MPQSLMQVYLHIIFSTKLRKNIIDIEIEPELYNYISAIAIELKCPVVKIGGTENHLHILCRLGKMITVPKLLETIKNCSSKWIKTKGDKYSQFYWQNGYSAISVNPSQQENLIKYIDNQKVHHQRVSYEEELREFLKKYGVEYDEKYLWD